MPRVIKTSTKYHELKRADIELRKAGVSLSTIRTQLKLPEGDIQTLDPDDGQPILVHSMPRRLEEVILREVGTTTC